MRRSTFEAFVYDFCIGLGVMSSLLMTLGAAIGGAVLVVTGWATAFQQGEHGPGWSDTSANFQVQKFLVTIYSFYDHTIH